MMQLSGKTKQGITVNFTLDDYPIRLSDEIILLAKSNMELCEVSTDVCLCYKEFTFTVNSIVAYNDDKVYVLQNKNVYIIPMKEISYVCNPWRNQG